MHINQFLKGKEWSSKKSGPTIPEMKSDSLTGTLQHVWEVLIFVNTENSENEQWDVEEVNDKLRAKMAAATESVIESQTSINASLGDGRTGDRLEPVDLRTAAFALAIRRVAEVRISRGIWP